MRERDIETWRNVPGYEGHYEVSDMGNVVSTKSGTRKFMTPLAQTSGHLGVPLCLNGEKVRKRIHSLVMLAFVGPYPEGHEVRHLNGDPTDNRLCNLQYGTASENRADAYAHRGRKSGQRSHLAKVSDECMDEIKQLKGVSSSREVALKYGVSDSYVRQVWRGESRKHDAKESVIEGHLVERVKHLGGEVRKLKWVGRNSAPDRLVMLPAKPPLFVELKRPGGLATFPCNARERAQLREHERMRKMGQRVVVVDSIEGVEELLR